MAEPLPSFVGRSRPRWEELRALLEAHRKGTLRLEQVRALDQLYRKSAADLARAQADYPGTDVHRYLNGLCAQAYGAIYQPPRERLASIRAFFTRELPRTVRAELPYVAVSAGLFVLGLAVGALVVALEPRGDELLVPESVRASVLQGRMWTDSLLALAPPELLASGIATNNLSAVIGAFASGLLLGVGPVFVLVYNGVHLGAVSAFCAREGVGARLLDFISAHGPVELSIITLAGAAGLMVGHAIIDPGERPRGVHLRLRGLAAVKMVVGTAPFLAAIAVVEGYVSPGDLFPTWAKASLGVTLGIAFWLYLLRAGGSPLVRSRSNAGFRSRGARRTAFLPTLAG